MSGPGLRYTLAVATLGACIGAAVGWAGAQIGRTDGPTPHEPTRAVSAAPDADPGLPQTVIPPPDGDATVADRLTACEAELEDTRRFLDAVTATSPSITVAVPPRLADSQHEEAITAAAETIRRRCAPDLMLGPIDCAEYPCLALTTSVSPETAMAVMDCAQVDGYFANPLDHLEITVDGRSAVGAVMAFYTDGETQVTDDAGAELQRTKERAATLVEHGSDWLRDSGTP